MINAISRTMAIQGLSAAGLIGKTIISNPGISAAALGVLSSPYWAQGAEAGPAAYAACMTSCMAAAAASAAAFSGGTALAAAGVIYPNALQACIGMCTPLLAAPTP